MFVILCFGVGIRREFGCLVFDFVRLRCMFGLVVLCVWFVI